jgi:ribonuclease D
MQVESVVKLALPFRRHIDVLLLAKAAMRAGRLGPSARPGLQRLCCAVLGSILDKSQQRSQWQQRPLAPQQIAYAAADAHCLTAIFDALVSLLPQVIMGSSMV